MALREPREAAVTLLSLGMSRDAIWLGLGLAAVAGALLSGIGELLVPSPLGNISPLVMAVAFFLLFTLFSLAVWKVGEAMGGTGSMMESLLLTAFIQTLIVGAQALQLGLILTVPSLAGVISLGILLYGIWINVAFIDALHGFGSVLRSFAVFFLSSFVLALLLTMFGSLFIGPSLTSGAV